MSIEWNSIEFNKTRWSFPWNSDKNCTQNYVCGCPGVWGSRGHRGSRRCGVYEVKRCRGPKGCRRSRKCRSPGGGRGAALNHCLQIYLTVLGLLVAIGKSLDRPVAKTDCFIFTARKRSCGKVVLLQVSVILFTGGEVWCRGAGPGGCLVPGGAWSGGGAWSRGVPGGDPPGRLLLRAVRILLECILVNFYESRKVMAVELYRWLKEKSTNGNLK